MMNDLMDIKNDRDVIKMPKPSSNEINSFLEEGPRPKLKPMRLHFNGKVKHPWNLDLAEQFVGHFMSRAAVDRNDEDNIWTLFEQRFLNLKRKVKEREPKDDEDEIQVLQQVVKRRKVVLSSQRPNTRCGMVSPHTFS